jgi:S-adenosylmethionine decarboxylase
MPDTLTVLPDYFVNDGTETFAGTHLLVDVIDAINLTEPAVIKKSLERAALAAGATILHGHFHSFGPGQGVSGVLVLAESHISIHTWPDRRFAAIDIFMCGKCDPMDTLPEIRKTFSDNLKLSTQKRGLQIQAG